jgi:hypothetical protein
MAQITRTADPLRHTAPGGDAPIQRLRQPAHQHAAIGRRGPDCRMLQTQCSEISIMMMDSNMIDISPQINYQQTRQQRP